MGHAHAHAAVRAERLEEPRASVLVEVVGRLVEEERVGFCVECVANLPALLLAARQGLEPREVRGVEAERRANADRRSVERLREGSEVLGDLRHDLGTGRDARVVGGPADAPASGQ